MGFEVRFELMKYALIIVLLFQNAVWAYQSPEFKFVIESPLRESKSVEKIPGLKMSRLERSTKASLAKTKILNPAKFNEIKNNKLENSELYQSWVNEVDAALAGKKIKANPKAKIDYYAKYIEGTPVDVAKKIAKRQMLNLILRNWNSLKETIFNDAGIESREQARQYAFDQMNKAFIYVPRKNTQNSLFMLGDSFVEVDGRSLKTGRSGLDVDTRFENSLKPEAENIVADDDGVRKSGQVSKNTAVNTPSTQEVTKPAEKPSPSASPSATDTFNLESF